MSYINFKKEELVNLEFSLNREILRANKSGSYACLTLAGCNTRKYHGHLVSPQPALDGENHVLLSDIDVTVMQDGEEFNLGLRKYPNNTFIPKGHKYMREFSCAPNPKTVYRVGSIVLSKEMLYLGTADQLIVKYTIEEAAQPVKLMFKPFLAFRQIHKLSKANNDVERGFQNIENGIKLRMYSGYSYLHIQFSKKTDYVHLPDWYYNVEYQAELDRGYDGHEDLYVPGHFETSLSQGQSIYLSASTEEVENPKTELKKQFEQEMKTKTARSSYENCLKNSAGQFIVRQGKKTEIVAGYPWFGRWGRDTFIALPGLTLSLGDTKTCKEVIDTMISELNGPLFPNIGSGDNSAYNSIDAPMWFFRALQQYAEATGTQKKIWKEYGEKMRMILDGYRYGTHFDIHALDNGLIYGGVHGKALTWMDAVYGGKAFTPRIGQPVEINALWYNAVMFSLEVAKLAKDKEFVEKWQSFADQIPQAFVNTFWDDNRGYLADVVNGDYKDFSMRPNQVIATALPYMCLSTEQCESVLKHVRQSLVTPRGLRTLSPTDPAYCPVYEGNQEQRDGAYHQGTVWPWLLGPFAEGYLKVYGKQGVDLIEKLYNGFEETITEYCLGAIAEIYDGDPPHKPKGAISQAWSTSALLQMKELVEKYRNA